MTAVNNSSVFLDNGKSRAGLLEQGKMGVTGCKEQHKRSHLHLYTSYAGSSDACPYSAKAPLTWFAEAGTGAGNLAQRWEFAISRRRARTGSTGQTGVLGVILRLRRSLALLGLHKPVFLVYSQNDATRRGVRIAACGTVQDCNMASSQDETFQWRLILGKKRRKGLWCCRQMLAWRSCCR